jgi:threonylcarbamoyladenosine tRNA methylthiotransferase MtaB
MAGFSRIHSFPFSAIEGTAAWNWRGQAPPPGVVRQRMAELAQVERHLADQYRRQFLGQTVEALAENPNGPLAQALTDRYLMVFFDPPPGQTARELAGKVVRLRLDQPHPDGLRGQWV